jgi:predicted SAM-dependent methyltransferase
MTIKDKRSFLTYSQRTFTSPTVKQRVSWTIRAGLTTLLSPYEKRKAETFEQTHSPLRLHLGSGTVYMAGWVNIDTARPGHKRDLNWDLTKGLPFSDGTVTAVFSEHMLEHFTLEASYRLFQEIFRVLQSGGILRISVPNLRRYVESYLGLNPLISQYRPNSPTAACALNEIFYLHGHRTMFDFETLSLMLTDVGFANTKECQFQDSALTPCPDHPMRQTESLYVEATKLGH